MKEKVDLLLITVNDHETKAVIAAFEKETGPAKGIMKAKRRYNDLGTINETRVFHTVSEQGSLLKGAAHQTVVKAIDALNPSAAIAIGIAFGVNKEKQSIGQILISKQIFLYDPQRKGKTKIYRGPKPDASTWLLNYFRTFSQVKWREPKVQIGLILSGESLLDNIAERKALVKQEPEAIGGEMEGAGLYVGTDEKHVEWIIIKAICDWADGDVINADKEKNQELAAKNSVDFLMKALKDTRLIENGGTESEHVKADQSPNSPPSPTREPLKRSMPEFKPLEKSQVIEFHGGELCNQMVRVEIALPKLISFPVEREQWSNYMRVDHLSKDGKIVYSHNGTGSSGGKPIDYAVPVIATREGQKLISLRINPDSIRDKVSGLAISLESRFKMEKWGRENKDTVELTRVIERYDLTEQEIESALDELGLLNSEIDGVVFDQIRDAKAAESIRQKLQNSGLKIYIVNQASRLY